MGLKELILLGLLLPTSAWAQVIHGTGTIHDNDAPAGSQTFAQRCAAPGVVKCVSFDTAADFSQGAGGTQGSWGARFGVNPPYGTSDYTRSNRDTTVYADGGGSLRFTIPATAGSDVAGSWFTNFKDDLSYQVGEGQDVWIQWRQRFTPGYLTTMYQASGGGLAGGWKLADISAGDKPTCSLATANSILCPTTCWDFEVIVQNTNQLGFPQMYANCAGQYGYEPMLGYSTNYTAQNVFPGCVYPTYPSPPCVKFFPNEWMTFKVHIHVGTWNTWSSTIQLWVARQGQAQVLVIDCSPTATNKCYIPKDGIGYVNGWFLDSADTSYKIGKVWLVPYHTSRSSSYTYTDEYTWYDDLVISSQDIADAQ